MALEPHYDFHAFLEQLRQDDDLVEIDTAIDHHLEAGVTIRKTCETDAQCALFNNVKDMQNGLCRLVGLPAVLHRDSQQRFGRVARHLGLPSRRGRARRLSCRGGECDVDALPSPLLHMSDGTKYIQPYGMHVLKGPEEEWVNWSIARAHVVDATHLVGIIDPNRHIGEKDPEDGEGDWQGRALSLCIW